MQIGRQGDAGGLEDAADLIKQRSTTELALSSPCSKCDAHQTGALWRGERATDQAYQLTTEERAKIEEIQDLLIERYVTLREAHEEDQNARTHEIDELRREIDEIKRWAKI